ncbi:hypothetical protein [Chitinimonas lacunae]|uniref:Uncharacterized protein n=1 Tax=Chitinimonas lacunae TaxID=1963018 RepID=A0ABV8MPI8_9NEIS
MTAVIPNKEKFPPDHTIDGKIFSLAYHGRVFFEEKYKNPQNTEIWPVENYEICISIYEEENCASISFCPKMEDFIEGFTFEISRQGLWENGPGVTFYLSLHDYSLIKTVSMR